MPILPIPLLLPTIQKSAPSTYFITISLFSFSSLFSPLSSLVSLLSFLPDRLTFCSL